MGRAEGGRDGEERAGRERRAVARDPVLHLQPHAVGRGLRQGGAGALGHRERPALGLGRGVPRGRMPHSQSQRPAEFRRPAPLRVEPAQTGEGHLQARRQKQTETLRLGQQLPAQRSARDLDGIVLHIAWRRRDFSCVPPSFGYYLVCPLIATHKR